MEFRKVKKKYNPSNFKSKHQLELTEFDEELSEFSTFQESIQQDIITSERIRLPSGSWILPGRLTSHHKETHQCDPDSQQITQRKFKSI